MQDIGAIFKKMFKGHQKTLRPFFGVDAYDDWKKLLIIFIVINILLLLWSGYLFYQINQGNIFAVSPASNASAELRTKNNLNNILNVYGAREKHFEDLRAVKPAATDPAL